MGQGDCWGPFGNIDDLLQWFPSELINALRFAAGSDVEAPWIEIRARTGKLVRRIHSTFGRRGIRSGSGALSGFDAANPSSGLGEFVRCYFLLPEDRRNRLI